MFLIRSRDITKQKEILTALHHKCLKLERRPPLYFISFCPYQRAQMRQLKKVVVLNPYEWRQWGSLRNGVLWLDQWPSFTGSKWRELRYYLLGQHHILFFQQSFVFKGETFLLKKFASEDLRGPAVDVHSESLPSVSFVPFQRLILQRYIGEDKRGVLLLDERKWPRSFGNEIFIPQCIAKSSEVLALAHSNRVLVAGVSDLSYWRVWSIPETLLCWLLAGQLGADLLNWLGANKGRRHSHSQGSLSGTSRHWYASFKKWALHFSSFLWRPRGRQKAQSFNFRAWLYDEGGAKSQSLHQRAS
jgi:hypothetical protein